MCGVCDRVWVGWWCAYGRELFSRGLELYAGMEAEAIAQRVLLPQALAKKGKTKHTNISFVQFINHTKLTAYS